MKINVFYQYYINKCKNLNNDKWYYYNTLMQVNISKASLGDLYESKLKMFFEEYVLIIFLYYIKREETRKNKKENQYNNVRLLIIINL